MNIQRTGVVTSTAFDRTQHFVCLAM